VASTREVREAGTHLMTAAAYAMVFHSQRSMTIEPCETYPVAEASRA